ncbi:12170_t:CDS:2, partial [Racocetra persica]
KEKNIYIKQIKGLNEEKKSLMSSVNNIENKNYKLEEAISALKSRIKVLAKDKKTLKQQVNQLDQENKDIKRFEHEQNMD